MLFVKSDRPIAPLTVAAMREVDVLMKELELSYFVCGATARDLLLQHVYGIETGTATVDVDFGVAVADWEQFADIKARLIATGRFEPAKNMAQRLYYKPSAESRGYPVDIIPFRGVEQPLHSIAWPPDMDIAMNVIGYEEALATALGVQIQNGFVVPVISLPGLALLKLFAWADRGFNNSKDARDLLLLFGQYVSAGNQERLYGEAVDVMVTVEYDIDLAGPHLLGRDVRTIAAGVTLAQIIKLIDDAKTMDRLLMHIAASLRGSEDSIGAAERLLERFKAGLTGK
jgi:predicted nucleotidyltransferase